MPPKPDQAPTYSEIIKSLLDVTDGPIAARDLTEQILLLRPSSAKNPAQAIKSKLREETGRLLVFLDKDTIIPMRLVMNGIRFRVQLNHDAIQLGLIEIGVTLKSYFPWSFPIEKIRLMDGKDQPLEFQLKSITQKEEVALFGIGTSTYLCADLGNWLHQQKANEQDYLLFTLIDWQTGVFRLEYEPYTKQNAILLAQRNQLLADLLYEMLENSTQEELYQHQTIPTVYARLPDKSGYPLDHWMNVLEYDGRMITDGWTIRYADGQLSPFQELARELSGETREIPLVAFSKEQEKQVYRIKAERQDKPAIWREVEILGKQTLANLNTTLVNSFGYDSDHMAGFWKLIPRKGVSKVRYREVDLGDVNPLDEGDAASIKIVELGLSENDKLKFVFDFGEWIEHTLTLEAITPSQAKVKYPCETARNKPKYVSCINCKEEGRKTTGQLICLTCSNEHQKEMVYCEACSESHEGHYLEEILY